MRFGSFDRTYEEYYGIPRNILNDETPSLTFAKITSEIKPTKNHKLLLEVAAAQKKTGLVTGGNVKKRAVKK